MIPDHFGRVGEPGAQAHEPFGEGSTPPSSRSILYSYQIGAKRGLGGTEIQYGYAHYTYAVVAKRTIELIRALGHDPREVLRPEIVPAPTTRPGHGDPGRPVHIIFKPAEHIRILRGAYNIGLIYWEFDAINHEALDKIPFSNHRRMLGLLDEIWVACEYTKGVLNRAGLDNVHVVPCPVPMPDSLPEPLADAGFLDGVDALPLNFKPGRPPIEPDEIKDAGRLLRERGRTGKVFLAILNPQDWRKDIGCLIESFCAFAAGNPGHVLIIKCVVDDVQFSIRTMYDMIHYRFSEARDLVSNDVLFISKRVTNEQMADLYRFADFYYCTSRAEGQCLPLIEAMSQGCVPVSAANTAMMDYIDETNAIVIDTFRKRVHEGATEPKNTDLFWFQAPLDGCVAQLEAAPRLDAVSYEAMRRRARRKVETLFAPEPVGALIASRLASIA